MPINYNDYPPNWKTEIRPRILERDGNCCKFCGVENNAMGIRLENGHFLPLSPMEQEAAELDGLKVIKIVLTIAHLNDPNPMNCDDDNLAALCQKCHNKHDAPMRRVNAKATIEAKKQAATGQINLF